MGEQYGARGGCVLLEQAVLLDGEPQAAEFARQLRAIETKGAAASPDRVDQGALELILVSDAQAFLLRHKLGFKIVAQARAQGLEGFAVGREWGVMDGIHDETSG